MYTLIMTCCVDTPHLRIHDIHAYTSEGLEFWCAYYFIYCIVVHDLVVQSNHFALTWSLVRNPFAIIGFNVWQLRSWQVGHILTNFSTTLLGMPRYILRSYNYITKYAVWFYNILRNACCYKNVNNYSIFKTKENWNYSHETNLFKGFLVSCM